MILFEELEIRNYKVIKETHLKNLRDLNIFIGPNNCGKSSIIDALNLITKLKSGGGIKCPQCRQMARDAKIQCAQLGVSKNEQYLRANEVEISYRLNEAGVEKIVPGELDKVRNVLKKNCGHPGSMEEVRMKGVDNLFPEHISPFFSSNILEGISKSVVYCPDKRLENYKGKPHQEYIRGKNLRGKKLREWEGFLREMVDISIEDHTQALDLIRSVEGNDFETSLMEQGSGVRSLAGIGADLKDATNNGIIIIDEPELGLNSTNKQELMKLLLAESENKQVFLATHDSTFVNPVLWENDKVAVFLYSPIKKNFVKINLDASNEDPEVFGGYLPHTNSLKEFHIYVEGASDVYIHQVFLRKYLKDKLQDWAKQINRVGIFHLGGDFWQHLLYTIPKPPYKCIVVLDGDKRESVQAFINKNEEPNFIFAEKMHVVESIIDKEYTPIYCLKLDNIEGYLKMEQSIRHKSYIKGIHGPLIAEGMEVVPEELGQIYETILRRF